MSKLTISLVTYNSERFIHDLCDSLHEQTFTDWDLLVIDNNSSDRSAAAVRECMPKAKISVQKQNLGFAKAHNLNISWSSSEYILVINPDIVLAPNYLERMVAFMDTHDECGAVAGKLLQWDHEQHVPTGYIDSCGLELKKNYKIIDRFQSQQDHEIASDYVFGVSGALALYRREALNAVSYDRSRGPSAAEYFDEDFFAYKEDADLAWRLILAGWKAYCDTSTVSYHYRVISSRNASRRERKMRSGINRYSYRNHLLMIMKDHYWALTLRNLPSIMVFEIKKFIYLLFLDASSWKGLIEALRLAPRIYVKRRMTVRTRKLRAREFREWLT